MTISDVIFIAILSLNAVMLMKMYKSHGDMRYQQGRLAGFRECSKTTEELLGIKK